MSTTLDLLHVPRSYSANFDRAFSVQGPKLWNGLPADIRNSTCTSRFKSELKRYWLYNNKMRENCDVYVTAPLQLSDEEARLCLDES